MTRPAAKTARVRAEKHGHRAETIALLLLRLKGYRVIGQRVRTPVGEIDLVMRKGQTLVAVEVKYRQTQDAARLSLSQHQQGRIARALEAVAKAHGHTGPLRLDMMVLAPRRWPRHIRNAWQV